MTPIFIILNCLICCICLLLLIPVVTDPVALKYKKGIPILILLLIIGTRFIFPYSFSFTKTIGETKVLPFIVNIFLLEVAKNLTFGEALFYIWIMTSTILFIRYIIKFIILGRVLNMVPNTKDSFINETLVDICHKKNIERIPKVIQFNTKQGPFLFGYKNPVIVLPFDLSKEGIRYVLSHELEHYKNNHIFLKIITDIVNIVYWWNPIVWYIHNKLLLSLEIQTDLCVINDYPDIEIAEYLYLLLKGVGYKERNFKQSVALSFNARRNSAEVRVKTILDYHFKNEDRCLKRNKKLLVVLSSFIFAVSIFYRVDAFPSEKTEISATKIDIDLNILANRNTFDILNIFYIINN